MFAKHSIGACLMALACLASQAGCAGTNWLRFGKEPFPVAGPTNPIVNVVTLWQPSKGVGLENRTCRGFSGQVLFMTHGSPTPAKVDGTVVVYVFDDQGAPEDRERPLDRFEFEPEAWDPHGITTNLGRVYSVFIPYSRKGTHQADCSLMVRYIPRDGASVDSEMARIELPGSKSTAEPRQPREPQQDYGTAQPPAELAEAVATTFTAAAQGQKRARAPAESQLLPDLQQMARQVQPQSRSAAAGARQLSPDEIARIQREHGMAAGAPAVRQAGWNDDDDDEFDEPGEVIRASHTRSRPASRPHPLAGDDDGDEEEQTVPVSTRARPAKKKAAQQETRQAPPRHPLEDDDEDAEQASRKSRRANTLTLSLSGQGR